MSIKSETRLTDAARVVEQAVEVGLDAIEDDAPGLISLAAKELRDKLELPAWRQAVAGGLNRMGASGVPPTDAPAHLDERND